MIQRMIFLLGFLVLCSCTDAVPEVSQLEIPPAPALPKVQSATFASTDLAGAKEVTSADSYKAKVLIHGGTVGKKVTSPDHYILEVRQLSF